MQLHFSMILILRNRKGEPVGQTTVDEADFAFLSQWQWRLLRTRWGDYAMRCESRSGVKQYFYLHRVLLGLTSSAEHGDHIDGDGLNNQRNNLRRVTKAENAQNIRSQQGSSSKYRGVCWDKSLQKWRARVKHNGKHHNVGQFDSEEAARQAVLSKRLELMPFATTARGR